MPVSCTTHTSVIGEQVTPVSDPGERDKVITGVPFGFQSAFP